MEQSYMIDVATLFHLLLFAYQKSVKELLGSGSAIFAHPTIETLNKVERKRGLNLPKNIHVSSSSQLVFNNDHARFVLEKRLFL
jgi:hypothetical protein